MRGCNRLYALAGVLSLAMLSQSAGFDSKTWMYMGAKIHVTLGKKESGSIGSYLVSVVAPGGKRGTVRADRDGSLVGAWAADIDGDKKLEVIVATQSAGNGSYGKAGVFSWTGSSLKAKVVPELNRTQLNGYRGHDTFSVSRNTLYRSFPVYTQKGNSPAKKVGTRTLKLNLKKFRWESA